MEIKILVEKSRRGRRKMSYNRCYIPLPREAPRTTKGSSELSRPEMQGAKRPKGAEASFDFFHQVHCASPMGYLLFRKIWRKNNIGWESNAEGISHAKCGKFPLWVGFSPRKPVFESLVVVFSFCYKYFCAIKKKLKLDIIAVSCPRILGGVGF